MIKFEHTEVVGWEAAIRGMRNPMNSWDRNDSYYGCSYDHCDDCCQLSYGEGCNAEYKKYFIGPNDLDLMKKLRNAGPDHRKFMRMIAVYVDITAPLYWWKEFKTYRAGRKFGDDEPDIFGCVDDGYLEYDIEMNSCSTMHKIHEKEFTRDDFSFEQIDKDSEFELNSLFNEGDFINDLLMVLNHARCRYLKTKDKKYWWQMIQLLPSSYNQKRTVMLNYEVLANMYKSRKNHKLDEWAEHKTVIKDLKITGASFLKGEIELEGMIKEIEHEYFGFCDWIKTLPYSELITGEEKED